MVKEAIFNERAIKKTDYMNQATRVDDCGELLKTLRKGFENETTSETLLEQMVDQYTVIHGVNPPSWTMGMNFSELLNRVPSSLPY